MKAITIAVAVIALTGFMVAGTCHAEDEFSEQDLRVFDGKVTNVNTSRSVITVKGSVQIDFPVSTDTKIVQDTPDIDFATTIKLTDIDIGDYVTVQYYCKGAEGFVPAKVLMVTVEYKAKPTE